MCMRSDGTLRGCGRDGSLPGQVLFDVQAVIDRFRIHTVAAENGLAHVLIHELSLIEL